MKKGSSFFQPTGKGIHRYFMITKGAVTGYEFPYGYSVIGKSIEGMDVMNSIVIDSSLRSS
jgi:hypothetical protein